jgi:hypothetical protein
MTTPEQRQKLIDIVNAGLVAAPDRAFAIRVNDALWSSPEARAQALLPLALAQQGTAGTDRGPWVQRVVEGTIRRIVPIALRVAARVHPDEQHSAALEDAAIRCERKGTRVAAYAAVSDARAARAAAYAADAHSVNAVAARAAAYAADANFVDAVAAADYAARAAAYAVLSVAADAAYAASDRDDRDDVLRLAVQIALDAYAAEGRTP